MTIAPGSKCLVVGAARNRRAKKTLQMPRDIRAPSATISDILCKWYVTMLTRSAVVFLLNRVGRLEGSEGRRV